MSLRVAADLVFFLKDCGLFDAAGSVPIVSRWFATGSEDAPVADRPYPTFSIGAIRLLAATPCAPNLNSLASF